MSTEKEILLKFSENLKKLRIQKGLTQLEVCTPLNISRSVYSEYESNNPRDLRFTTVIKLANFFQVSIDDLIKD